MDGGGTAKGSGGQRMAVVKDVQEVRVLHGDGGFIKPPRGIPSGPQIQSKTLR